MNTMHCSDIQNHWDDRRDGDLAPDAAAAFDAHLRGCPACGAAWQRETAWIDELSSSRDEGSAQSRVPAVSSQPFTTAVLDRWQAQRAGRRPVLARLGPLLAIAASLVIVAGVALQFFPASEPTPIAASPLPGDPVGVLMQDMSDGMERQPAAVRSAIAQTTSIFDLDRLADLFDNKPPG